MDADGREVRYEYDLDGRLVGLIDGNSNVIRHVYNDALTAGVCGSCVYNTSKPVRTIYPTFTKDYRYDKRGRKTLEQDILSAAETYITRYAYDEAGNVITKTDKEGRTTTYEYDAFDRLTKATDCLGGITEYTYDNQDNLIALKDAKGHTTTFTYDRNNRLTKDTRPLGQETTYQYNATGQLIRKTDARNQKIEYIFDDAGRTTQIRHCNAGALFAAKIIDLTYDNAGNLLTYSDGTTSAVYTHDSNSRKLSETTNYGPFSLRTGYTYNRNGTKKTFAYPDGTTIGYTYDGNNQITGMDIPGAGFISYSSYQWNRPARMTLPGGSTKDYTYDPLMRVKTIEVKDPAQNPIQYRYDYDKMDNITTRNTEKGSYAYSYDDLYRLSQVDKDIENVEAYTYDPVGNRLTSTTATNWTYDQNNELQGCDGTTYQYDANGNTIQKNASGQIRNYLYDAENRLIEVRDGGNNTIATYTYDAFGRRIKKDVGGTTTYYIYSDEGIIGEHDGTGNAIKTYGYRPNSDWTADPLFCKHGTEYYFYHNDHLGTPQNLTTTSGAIVWSATFDAFGKTTVDDGSTITNNLRYPGQYFDNETGLHYNYFRFYDMESGLFLTSDPIGFNGNDVNLYRYVWNNPVNWFDQFGLAGDGQTAWRIEWEDWNKNFLENNTCYGEGCLYIPQPPSLKPPPKGHSDFAGSDRFDFTSEDKGSTAPIPILGDPERHFRSWQESYIDVQIAVDKGDKDEFSRAMHRFQDFYFHYAKGYRWDPSKFEFGHAPDVVFFNNDPDSDTQAWQRANMLTKRMIVEWDRRWCGK